MKIKTVVTARTRNRKVEPIAKVSSVGRKGTLAEIDWESVGKGGRRDVAVVGNVEVINGWKVGSEYQTSLGTRVVIREVGRYGGVFCNVTRLPPRDGLIGAEVIFDMTSGSFHSSSDGTIYGDLVKRVSGSFSG